MSELCGRACPATSGLYCPLPRGHDGTCQVAFPSTANPGKTVLARWTDPEGGVTLTDA